MNKRKLSIILAAFILVQYAVPAQIFSAESVLLPQTRVDANYPDPCFEKMRDLISFGLLMYKLDVVERLSKEDVIMCFGKLSLPSYVKFDIKNIDMDKKGWTRYYRFSVGAKTFVMKIFLTKELQLQEKINFLYMGEVTNPDVTFQIFSLNDILSDCKAKPFKAYSSNEVNKSS